MKTKFFVFISSFIFSVVFPFVLEKLVIPIGSRAPIVSYATQFTIFSKKPVFWDLGPISEAFLGPNMSLFWQENVCSSLNEQHFPVKLHLLASIIFFRFF